VMSRIAVAALSVTVSMAPLSLLTAVMSPETGEPHRQDWILASAWTKGAQ